MSEQTIAERLTSEAGDVPALLKSLRKYSHKREQIADKIVYTLPDGSQIKFVIGLSTDQNCKS